MRPGPVRAVTRQPAPPPQRARAQSPCATVCLPICSIQNRDKLPETWCGPGCCGFFGWGPVCATTASCSGLMVTAAHQTSVLASSNPYIAATAVGISACCGVMGACITMYRTGMCGCCDCCGTQKFVVDSSSSSATAVTRPPSSPDVTRRTGCCCCPRESMLSSDSRGVRLQLDIPYPILPSFKLTEYV